MSETEVTADLLKETMELSSKLGDVLNGHPLYMGLSALTMIMAHLLVANENIAPADKAATIADIHLRQAIDMFRGLEMSHVTH